MSLALKVKQIKAKTHTIKEMVMWQNMKRSNIEFASCYISSSSFLSKLEKEKL